MADPDFIADLRRRLTFQQSKELTWEDAPGAGPDAPLDLADADLSQADLRGAVLLNADLHGANLYDANLCQASLFMADMRHVSADDCALSDALLSMARLDEAILDRAALYGATLERAVLDRASLVRCSAEGANFRGASLREACLDGANLMACDFQEADLTGASLRGCRLEHANLRAAILDGADLTGADLSKASLVETNLARATLDGCRVYGVAAWNVILDDAHQHNLAITPIDEPEVTVDNLPVAQFVYLLLRNEQLRNVIDEVSSKGVLILGRFGERKANLDAIRERLRERGYLPMLFDFAVPQQRDFTETVRTLAGISRFIVADLSDPSSIPQELQAIVPVLSVPVRPIIQGDEQPYSMSADLNKYPWMIREPFRYHDREHLLDAFDEQVIGIAEARLQLLKGL